MELNRLFKRLGIGRAAANQGGTGAFVKVGETPEEAFVTTSERFKSFIKTAQTEPVDQSVEPVGRPQRNLVPVTLVPNFKYETVGTDRETGEETGELVVRNTGQRALAEHAASQPIFRIREFLYADSEGNFESLPSKLDQGEAAARGLKLAKRNDTFTADPGKAQRAQNEGYEVEEHKPKMRQTEPKVFPRGQLPEDREYDWTRDEVLPINHAHEGGGVFRYQNGESGDLVPAMAGGTNYQFSELMTEQDPETGKFRRVNKPIRTDMGDVNPHDLVDWGNTSKSLNDIGNELEGQHGITFEPSLKPFRLTGKQIVNAHGHKDQDFTSGNRMAYMLAKLADNQLYQPIVEHEGKIHAFVPRGAKRLKDLPEVEQQQVKQRAAALAGEVKRLRSIAAGSKGDEKKQAQELIRQADREYIDFIAENWPEKLRHEVLSQPYVKHAPIHDKTGATGVRFHMGDTHLGGPELNESTSLYAEKGNEDISKYADHNNFVLKQLVDAFRNGVQQSVSKKSGTLNSARHVQKQPIQLPDGSQASKLAPISPRGQEAIDFFSSYPYFNYAMDEEDRRRIQQLEAAGLKPEEAAASYIAESPKFKRYDVKASADQLKNPEMFSHEDITYTDDDGNPQSMRVYRPAPGVKAADDTFKEVINRHRFSEADWGVASKIAEQSGLDEDEILFSMFAGRTIRSQKKSDDGLQLDSGVHPDQKLFEPDADEQDRQKRFVAKFNERVNDIYNEYGAVLSRDDSFVDDQGKKVPSRLTLRDESGAEKSVFLSELSDRQLSNLEKKIGRKITRVPSDLKRIQMMGNELATADPAAYANFAGKSDEERIEAEVQRELKKNPEAAADSIRKQVAKFFAQNGMTPSEQKRVSDYAFADARSRVLEQKMRDKSVELLRRQQPGLSDEEALAAVDDFARAHGGKTQAQLEMEQAVDGVLDEHMDDLSRALLANAKKKAARVGREHNEWPSKDTLDEWVSNAILFSLVPQTKDLTVSDLVRYNGEIKLSELPEPVKRQTASGVPYYTLMSVDDFLKSFPDFLDKFEAEAEAVREQHPDIADGSPEFRQKILDMVKERTARRYGMKTVRQTLLQGAGMPIDSPAWKATQALLRGADELPQDQVRKLLMRAYGAESLKEVGNIYQRLERAVGRNMNQLKDYGTPPQPDTAFGELGREFYRNLGRGRDFEKGRLQLQNEGVSDGEDAFNPMELAPDESMEKMFQRAEASQVAASGAYQEDAVLPVSIQQKVARDPSIRYSGSEEGHQMAGMAYGYADMLKTGFFDEDNPPPSRAQFAQFWKDRIAKQIDISKQEANRIRRQLEQEKEQGEASADPRALREIQRLEYILDRVLVPATRKGGNLMSIVGRMLALGRQYGGALKRMREQLADYQKLRHDYDLAMKEYEHVKQGGKPFSFEEAAGGTAEQQLLEELQMTGQAIKDAEFQMGPATDRLVQIAKEYDRYAAEVENFAVKMLPVNIEGLILSSAKSQGEKALRQELIHKFEAKASDAERMAKAKDSADNVIAASSLIELPAFSQSSFGQLQVDENALRGIHAQQWGQVPSRDLAKYLERMAVIHVNNMSKWDAAVGKTYDEGENFSRYQQTKSDFAWFIKYWMERHPEVSQKLSQTEEPQVGPGASKLDAALMQMERDLVPPGTLLAPDEVDENTPSLQTASVVAQQLKASKASGNNIDALGAQILDHYGIADPNKVQEILQLVKSNYVQNTNGVEQIISDGKYDQYMRSARLMMSQVETQMGVFDELIASNVTDRELVKMKDYQVASFLLKDIVEKMKDSEGPDGQLAPDSELAQEGVAPESYNRVGYAMGALDKKLAQHPALADRLNTIKQEALGILDEAFDGIDPHSEARRSPIDTEAIEAAHMVEARLLMKHRGLLEKMRTWSVDKVEDVVLELLGSVTPERAESIARNVVNDLHNAPGSVLGLVTGEYHDEHGEKVKSDGKDRYFRMGGEGSKEFEPNPVGDYVAVRDQAGQIVDYKHEPLRGYFRTKGMSSVDTGSAPRGERGFVAPQHLKYVSERLRDAIMHQGKLVKDYGQYRQQLDAMDENESAQVDPVYQQMFPGVPGARPSSEHFRAHTLRRYTEGMPPDKSNVAKERRHSLMPFSVVVHPEHPLVKPAAAAPAPAPEEVTAASGWVRIASILDECGWHEYAEHLDRKFAGSVRDE